MDRMIYLSMSGAKATMQRQETLANNLANVSTVGFRAELAAFRAVPVQGSGASTRVYALESTPGYDATPGPDRRDRPQPRRRHEGRRLARGAGARRHRGLHPRRLARDRRRGQPRHHRRPDRARRRRPDPGSARHRGQHRAPTARSAPPRPTAAAAPIGRLKLVTPEGAARRAAPTACSAPPTASSPPIRRAPGQDGALEGSNVSAVETMVAMIAAARQFEAQMKMLSTAESNEKAAAQLLSVG